MPIFFRLEEDWTPCGRIRAWFSEPASNPLPAATGSGSSPPCHGYLTFRTAGGTHSPLTTDAFGA